MNLLTRFAETASRFPQRRAVADEVCCFTFAALNRRARQLGCCLAAMGLAGRPVAVLARHEAWTVALFFGAMYAGCPYVPLDPDAPEEKRSRILDDCGAAVVISHGPGGDFVVDEAVLDAAPCRTLPGLNCGPGDTAYLIYTSGSTGVPKGVAKTHGAVLSFLEAYQTTFGFSQENVLGNQTPFFFDASAKDIYVMAAFGAAMEVLPVELFTFPVRLIQYLNSRRVDFICWVPSALSVVSQLNTFSEVLPTTLKRVFFVGESFPVKQLKRWRAALPYIAYVNLYGSTEIAGVACYWRVSGPLGQALPIGCPMPNCVVHLVDETGNLIQAPGQVGELYIASPALAQGYVGGRDKDAFPTLDLGDGVTRRYFRTGDMARYDEKGNLVFAARRDNQIKHMGRRIELGEIEAAANGLPPVQLSCCLYDGKRIVLYCELVPGVDVTAKEIRGMLREKLSDYMVPGRVQILERLPLNQNGKIDRQALQAAR